MSDKPPIGTGHASAMFRLGLRELGNAFNPSPQSVADTLTPSEVEQPRQEPAKQPLFSPEIER